MIPIKKEIIELAFNKEKDLHKQLDELSNKSLSDSFRAHNISSEFYLPEHNKNKNLVVKKIGDIWRCDFLVNGREVQESYSIWRNFPNYYGSGDGKGMDEVLAASETEKILYTCDEYRIVLLRDSILGRTKNYWGYRIQPAVYALIDNKTNKVRIRERKAWRFKKILMDDLGKQKSKSFIDDLKLHNPFKLFIVKATETKDLEHIQNKLKISIDNPIDRFKNEMTKKNLWVCYVLGYGSRNYSKNSTWWFIDSDEKPTNEEAIEALVDIITWYDTNTYVEMLEKYRENKYDLNEVDLGDIEFKWDQVTRKLIPNTKMVFDIHNLDDMVNIANLN